MTTREEQAAAMGISRRTLYRRLGPDEKQPPGGELSDRLVAYIRACMGHLHVDGAAELLYGADTRQNRQRVRFLARGLERSGRLQRAGERPGVDGREKNVVYRVVR